MTNTEQFDGVAAFAPPHHYVVRLWGADDDPRNRQRVGAVEDLDDLHPAIDRLALEHDVALPCIVVVPDDQLTYSVCAFGMPKQIDGGADLHLCDVSRLCDLDLVMIDLVDMEAEFGWMGGVWPIFVVEPWFPPSPLDDEEGPW